MKRWLSPKLQLSLGLVSLTVSLILVAASLGLLPNEERAELEQRGVTATALAVQLAVLASRDDTAAIKDTIDVVVSRSPAILSIAIRDAHGNILAGSDRHLTHWRELPDGKSTATHIQVPLFNDDTPAGRIEIAFRPLTSGANPLDLGPALFAFVGFMAVTGFAGFYLVLGRALRELDPSRTIPKRIEAAFDTLAEGVLIIDDDERVLLANRAFKHNVLTGGELELGSPASGLPWLSSVAAPVAPSDLPWRVALEHEHPVLGAELSIRDAGGGMHRLVVNATRILDGSGTARGAIVTFTDVTALHETNMRLSASVEELRKAQRHISDQNLELQYLASRDPLTGCLNRRTFFEQAEALLTEAIRTRRPFVFMMVDADHFKRINDRFGHAFGDKVLVGLSDQLQTFCGAPHLVGRYGGEEFCVALIGLSKTSAEHVAEQVRRSVSNVGTWLPGSERVTVSIGLAPLDDPRDKLLDLVNRADKALYAAKTAGRNRVVVERTKDAAPTSTVARAASRAGWRCDP